MSAQTNETLVRSVFTAFNARKFDEATKHVTPKFEWRNVATGEIFRGPEGMRQFMEGWAHAFKDAKADVKRLIATDKVVVVEYIGRGTHTGPLDTPTGSVPATNRKAEIPFCDVATIEGDRLAAISTYFDSATMLNQLGVGELATSGAHK